MNIKEWNQFKKSLKELPLEQELRLLHASLAKEKNKEIQEKIQQEIKEVQKEKDELKEWKRTGVAPVPQPSPLVEMAERETPRPREVREETSPLETTVAREPVPISEGEQKQTQYVAGGQQEYKSTSYESLAFRAESLYIKSEFLDQQTQRGVERERFTSLESDSVTEQMNPMKATEMYKKKKETKS